MSQSPVPLTPAEQMRRIREMVLNANAPSSQDPAALLAAYFSKTSALRKNLGDLESKMLLKEPPPGSRLPVVGGLVHKFRAVWYQVALKWLAVPLLVQQNQFNTGTVQALRDLLAATEALNQSVKAMEARAEQMKERPVSPPGAEEIT